MYWNGFIWKLCIECDAHFSWNSWKIPGKLREIWNFPPGSGLLQETQIVSLYSWKNPRILLPSVLVSTKEKLSSNSHCYTLLLRLQSVWFIVIKVFINWKVHWAAISTIHVKWGNTLVFQLLLHTVAELFWNCFVFAERELSYWLWKKQTFYPEELLRFCYLQSVSIMIKLSTIISKTLMVLDLCFLDTQTYLKTNVLVCHNFYLFRGQLLISNTAGWKIWSLTD